MIKLVNVNKNYQSSKENICIQAIKSINLEFESKGLVFILGKSGSGKSTLLNLIAGIDILSRGNIIFNNNSIDLFSDKQLDNYRNFYVGIIFQEFNLLENFTVEENISLALSAQKENSINFESKINAVLDSVDLKGYSKRLVNEISGGERQRIAIARALIKEPHIILADEPTGNLDSENSNAIFSLLKRISSNKLVVVATHDRDYAYKYGDRVIELIDGKVSKDTNTSLSESVQTSDGYIDKKLNKKCNLSLGFTLKYSLKNILIKKFRTALNIITFSLALFLINMGLVYYFFDSDNTAVHAFEEANIEEINIYKTSSVDNEELYITFELEDMEGIVTAYRDKGIVINQVISKPLGINGEFSKIFSPTHLNTNIPSDSLEFTSITILNEEDSLAYISGSTPDELSEIVISDYMADMLIKYEIISGVYTRDNLIGSILSDNGSELIVSGIFDTDYEQVYSEGSTFSDLYDNGFIVSLNTVYCSMAMSENTYESTFNNVGKVLLNSDLTDSINNVTMTNENHDFEYQIIGHLPREPYEVAISLTFLDRYLEDSIIPGDITADEVAISEYLGRTIRLKTDSYGNEETEYIIVGIIDDFNEGNNIQLVFEESIFNFFEYHNYLDGKIIGLRLQFSSQGFDYNNITQITNQYNAKHYSMYSFELYSMSELDDNISPLLEGAGIVLILISSIMISSYISYSIQVKRKEIGILRALGVSKKEVTKIYFMQSFTILLLSYCLSVVFSLISIAIQNSEISDSWNLSIKLLYLDFKVYIASFLLVCFISTISTVIPVHKSIIMQPINAIRKSF
jgi:ABC-type lipoprotein export system ATPase subunit/ABC-type antimicrobial peptide transport system permease subunit